ncbi:MAG: hypothetical protein ACRCRZ_03105 [Metamycoplasmataceae bacterium]
MNKKKLVGYLSLSVLAVGALTTGSVFLISHFVNSSNFSHITNQINEDYNKYLENQNDEIKPILLDYGYENNKNKIEDFSLEFFLTNKLGVSSEKLVDNIIKLNKTDLEKINISNVIDFSSLEKMYSPFKFVLESVEANLDNKQLSLSFYGIPKDNNDSFKTNNLLFNYNNFASKNESNKILEKIFKEEADYNLELNLKETAGNTDISGVVIKKISVNSLVDKNGKIYSKTPIKNNDTWKVTFMDSTTIHIFLKDFNVSSKKIMIAASLLETTPLDSEFKLVDIKVIEDTSTGEIEDIAKAPEKNVILIGQASAQEIIAKPKFWLSIDESNVTPNFNYEILEVIVEPNSLEKENNIEVAVQITSLLDGSSIKYKKILLVKSIQQKEIDDIRYQITNDPSIANNYFKISLKSNYLNTNINDLMKQLKNKTTHQDLITFFDLEIVNQNYDYELFNNSDQLITFAPSSFGSQEGTINIPVRIFHKNDRTANSFVVSSILKKSSIILTTNATTTNKKEFKEHKNIF